MSEKPHTSGKSPHSIAAWKSLIWLAPAWLVFIASVYLMAQFGGRLLERLATADPDPQRREKIDGLRLTRGMLAPPPPGGQLIWDARRTGAPAGFFLAGAVRAERLGRPRDAKLWLAMELASRGKTDEARALLATSATAQLPLPDPAHWQDSPLARRLHDSLR